MTNAQWVASIEALGVLTTNMLAGHTSQALQDGDAALIAAFLAGTPLTAGQISARDTMLAVFSLAQAAAISSPGALLVAAARTQFVNVGSNYYTITGAP
jgi:hypothetical protein